MILRVGGSVHRGRAVSIDATVDPEVIAAAVREGRVVDGDVALRVTARDPHDAHERLGCLPCRPARIRTALAAAARARGLSAPQDPALARAREALADVEATGIDAADKRQAVAGKKEETDRLRERVAAARGRLEARRERGLPTTAAREELQAAIRELSETETGATAARQALASTRSQARSVRDDLERRFRLADEAANLERRARAWLVERVRDAYASALLDVPGGPDDIPADPFSVDRVTAGLAVARVAGCEAPVVLAADRFESADAASAWLDAPVIQVPA